MINSIDWLLDTWQRTGFELSLSQHQQTQLARAIELLSKIKDIEKTPIAIGDVITIGESSQVADSESIESALMELIPWRKGPFSIFGVLVDSEWRCNFKWDRFCNKIDWKDKRVLDVGCGNGYFGYRMLGAGARQVVGFEGHLPYVVQAALLQVLTKLPNSVLPLRFKHYQEDHQFDIVLSMGVLYHQRDQTQHLQDLNNACVDGGVLVLETLIADEDFVPETTYAGMKNVWGIASVQSLKVKLAEIGFRDIELLDVSTTTDYEQRRTPWMPFKSLADSIQERSTGKTIEGYPVPRRAIFRAIK